MFEQEEILWGGFASATGEHLDQLLQQAETLSEIQKGTTQSFQETRELQVTYMQLCQKRDKLKADLHLQETKTIGDRLLEQWQQAEEEKGSYIPPLADEETKAMVIESTYQQQQTLKVEDFKIAYRLIGKTLFYVKDSNQIGIRFDTFFGGKYHECYYAIIDFDYSTNQLVLYKHTIPYFIPLDTIKARFLNTNIKLFVDAVSDYLNAFVARREQVLMLQQEAKEIEDFKVSEASDFVRFRATYQERTYHCKVSWDLRSQYPKEVVISTFIDDKRKRWRALEKTFAINTLKKAYFQFFK